MSRKKQSVLKDLGKRYLRAVAIFFLIMITVLFLFWTVFDKFTWRETDMGWWVLHWLHKNIVMLSIICFLVGALFIMAFFAWKGYRRAREEVSVETAMRKDDLIVYLAHDLKTPLTSLIGYLSLLNDADDLPGEQRSRYTAIALSKAERLDQLINEFFEITRFTLTNMELQKEAINLSMMLSQIASEFEPLLAEKKLSIRLDTNPGVMITCDANKWERVIDNLIRNAIQYSFPETEIILSVEQQRDKVLMSVANTGETIPAEKLDRVFDMFFRVSASRDSSTGGAGLGLAIAREIVLLHGGEITVKSENGVTAFTVTL